MRYRVRSVTALGVLLLAIGGWCAASDQDVHWGYEGEEDPSHWGELAPEFRMCGEGRNRSPIDLQADFDAKLPELVFDYHTGITRAINNGHTIEEAVRPGSWLRFSDHRFELKQAHFHSPSEHTTNGRRFPMEVHLVHADATGRLAVIGVFVEEGAENPILKQLWTAIPEQVGGERELSDRVLLAELLPPTRDYFLYNGSLTTPPCSEGVLWLVLKAPVEASAEQIERFREVVGVDNNRPIQPRNSRMVLD